MHDLLPSAANVALRNAGYHPRALLGAGVEGVVFDIGRGQVAKVWHRASRADLERLRAFHDALRAAAPPLRTPRTLTVTEAGGHAVSIEERLVGAPMRSTMGAEVHVVSDADIGDILTVLTALASVSPAHLLTSLPVLPGEPAFPLDRPFTESLAALVERRAHRFRGSLAAAVDGLDAVVEAVTDSLRAIRAPAALVHGDLIPANILVHRPDPLAVLDFGFLTTVGDPCFDAAVTASIHDMYGPRHRDNERVLDEAIAAHFGYDAGRVAVYRAAYAVVTGNCFSSAGTDGHFAWCAAVLRRRDVRDAVGL